MADVGAATCETTNCPVQGGGAAPRKRAYVACGARVVRRNGPPGGAASHLGARGRKQPQPPEETRRLRLATSLVRSPGGAGESPTQERTLDAACAACPTAVPA